MLSVRLRRGIGLAALAVAIAPMAMASFNQPLVVTTPGANDLPASKIRFEMPGGILAPVEPTPGQGLQIKFPGEVPEPGVLVMPNGQRIQVSGVAPGNILHVDTFLNVSIPSPVNSPGLSIVPPPRTPAAQTGVRAADDLSNEAFIAAHSNRQLLAALDTEPDYSGTDLDFDAPMLPDIKADNWEIAVAAAFDDLLTHGYVDPDRAISSAQHIAEIRADPGAAAARADYVRQEMRAVVASIESRTQVAIASANAQRWQARQDTVRALRAYEREAGADGVWTPAELERYEALHQAVSDAWEFTPEEEAAMAAQDAVRQDVMSHVMDMARVLDTLNAEDLEFLKNANAVTAEIIDWQNFRLPLLGEVNLTFTGETAGWMRDRIYNAKASLIHAENVKLAAEMVMKDPYATADQKRAASDIYQMADLLAFAAEDDIALGMAVTLFGTSADLALLGLGGPINQLAEYIGGGIRTAGGKLIDKTRSLFNRTSQRTGTTGASGAAGAGARGAGNLTAEELARQADLEAKFNEYFQRVIRPKVVELAEKYGISGADLTALLQQADSPALYAASPLKEVAQATLNRLRTIETMIEKALASGVRQPVVDDIIARARTAAAGNVERFALQAEAELTMSVVNQSGGRIIVEGAGRMASSELFTEIFGEFASSPAVRMEVENGLRMLRGQGGTFHPPSNQAQVQALREALHLIDDGAESLWYLDATGELTKLVDDAFLDGARNWLAQQSDLVKQFFAERPPPGADAFSDTLRLPPGSAPRPPVSGIPDNGLTLRMPGPGGAAGVADNATTLIIPPARPIPATGLADNATTLIIPPARPIPASGVADNATTMMLPGQRPSFRSAPTEVGNLADQSLTVIDNFGTPSSRNALTERGASLGDSAGTVLNPPRPFGTPAAPPAFFNAPLDDLGRMIDNQLGAPPPGGVRPNQAWTPGPGGQTILMETTEGLGGRLPWFRPSGLITGPDGRYVIHFAPGTDGQARTSGANCPLPFGTGGAVIGSTPMLFPAFPGAMPQITNNCLNGASDVTLVEFDRLRFIQQDRPAATTGQTPAPLPTELRARTGAIVAVIDSGIDWRHPDFDQQNLWWNPGEIAGNGRDDDNNGFVDDIIGWNFVADTNIPWDRAGHGTFVAGQIAGRAGSEVAGVNPDARIMVLKAVGDDGAARASNIVRAIAYAVDNGAKVINLSVGGEGLTQAETIAVEHAAARGVLVVVAAGNSNTDVAGFGLAANPRVITVAALDAQGRRAPFSNAGAQVDIAAPGVEIAGLRARRSDFMAIGAPANYRAGSAAYGPQATRYRATGTSFAAPLVAGAASLILTRRPNLDAESVRRMLLYSARDVETPGKDQFTGYGALNIEAALAADPAYFVESALIAAAPAMSGNRQVLRVTGTAQANRFRTAYLELGAGENPTEWRRVGTALNQAVEAGAVGELEPALFSGSPVWTLRLIVEHADGTRREARYRLNLG